ncbi:MAG: TRAP transporter substrate-binding protein DctP [Gammaproteobacteria bacterium]
MKKSVSLAALLALVLALPATVRAHPYVLSLSTWGSPKHPQVTHFVPEFVKLVERRSHGRIKFRVFSGGEMVKQRFVPTAIPQDTVDISLTTLDSWAGRIPETSILTSPLWTWSMQDALHGLVPGKPVFDYFQHKLEAQDARMIAMFDIGPPVLVTNFQLRNPSDLKGHTMRVYSKGAGLVMQTLGAAPATIGVGEVYSALQRGTVQGAMGGLGGAVGLKYYEVSKYTFAPMGALGTMIHAYVMNESKFESLPPDLQKVVMESATQARNDAQRYLISSYGSMLNTIRDHGVDVYELHRGTSQWKKWRAALEPLTKKSEHAYAPKLVKMVASQSGS